MYHRVQNKALGKFSDPALWVNSSSFEMHITQISKVFDIVPLSTLLSFPKNDRGMCAITFDDGWIDTYEIAFPILKRHHIPATVFVSTGLVGEKDPFWFDGLANLANKAVVMHQEVEFMDHFKSVVPTWQASELNVETLGKLVSQLKMLSADILMDVVQNGYKVLGVTPDDSRSVVDWEQIAEMNNQNVSFGSHGFRHYILPTVSSDLKKEEIFNSLDMLRQKTFVDYPVFCYPNGDWDSESIGYISEAGYKGATTTNLGYNTENTDHFLLKRIGLHEFISSTPGMLWFRIFQGVHSGWE
jgi:peptidoglycan/xylan/chitin deacetylase (PgdA/CDA1 family)